MIITNTITKKLLENIVKETFSKFGNISSSSLLDSLKLLGFSYATSSGISINIEDLKTPNSKENFINIATLEIQEVSKNWQEGNLSDMERFQKIIDSWNIATESLKNRIVEYYQNYDPANNLYIMAFSGARGNMSQVRQLVGMRGLMSDQEGKIIDLPIQSNFREGLSSIDYIISSYGARKGIVDTALKTADSGYLTRRLIYLSQDLIIRQKECGTTKGIVFLLEKQSNIKNLIGRGFFSFQKISSSSKLSANLSSYENFKEDRNILTISKLNYFKKYCPGILTIRSPLNCRATESICQNCYGWDLAHEKLISLGEAVGIIAAQSIGEPGTQLTMRTFHTGGIFTGELLKQIVAPFSGKVIFPLSFKTVPYRTPHGVLVLRLRQEIILKVFNWEGISHEIFLDIGSFLYINNSSFIQKGQLIAEYMTQSVLIGGRKLKPIISPLNGEIRFENLFVRKMLRDKRIIKVNQDDGILWITSGKILVLPKELNYFLSSYKFLEKIRPFSSLNLIIPFNGIISYDNNLIEIKGEDKDLELNLNRLKFKFKDSFIKFSLFVKNNQFVDKYTILGRIYLFSNYQGQIYAIRKKNSKYNLSLFLITEEDIWRLNPDQLNDFSFFQTRKSVIRTGTKINLTSKIKNSGFFLKKEGFKMIFQHGLPIFLSRGTILNYKQGDFVLKKKILATLVNYTQQTEDIVQGLPKIEELIEARKPKIKSYLASRPGVLLDSSCLKNELLFKVVERELSNENIILCKYPEKESIFIEKQEKQNLYLVHSLFLKKSIILFNSHIYKMNIVPLFFEPYEKPVGSKKFVFIGKGESLLVKGKSALSSWTILSINFSEFKQKKEFQEDKLFFLYKYEKNTVFPYLTINIEDCIYKNKRGDLMIPTKEKGYIFLEYLNPIKQYEIPISSKIIFEPGNFIDIGEPMTEGMIDMHELLQIFFKYHCVLDGIMKATRRSLNKFQLLLVHSIQSIYQSQGVAISSKHTEIIVRQMTAKIVIRDSGDTPLLPGELIRLSFVNEIYESLKQCNSSFPFKAPKFEPILLSATNASLVKDGFLSSAGFQETKRVLTKSAIEGSTDWLRGLKECIIIGRIIPAGSTFLNYKNYLDNIYLFKN
jgi:hypothetical protein